MQCAQHISEINAVLQAPNLGDKTFQKRTKLNSIMHLQSTNIKIKECASFLSALSC
jgi:hypothetical protein